MPLVEDPDSKGLHPEYCEYMGDYIVWFSVLVQKTGDS